MTKEKFLYGLNACPTRYHNGQKFYEHDDLVKCFEDLGMFEQGSCEDWYDIPSDEMTLEQTRQAVKDLRKKLAECLKQEPFINKPCVAHQICHEDKVKVLDKIRAEIKQLPVEKPNMDEAGVFTSVRMKVLVLDIIDKYKVESEDEKC